MAQVRKQYLLDDFSLDPDKRLLSRADGPVHLANRPFQVLLYLIEHRDRLVTRHELLDRFWEGRDVYDDTLRKSVGAIRKALGDSLDQPRFIETRWAEGYRYIGPAEEQLLTNGPSVVEIERVRGVKIVIEEEETPEAVLDVEPVSRNTALSAPITETVGLMRSTGPRQAVALALILAIIVLAGSALVFYRNRANSGESHSSPIRSIAVLPLKNLTGDPAQEYFSDGVTESLITALSKVAGLKVISRGSVFGFKGREVDPREVGEKLGVVSVLEGSVRRGADRVRVEVRLVSAEDGRVLWASNTYDRALGDIFALQDEITHQVMASLRIKLSPEGEQKLAKRYTDNAEAYQAYLKGRYHWNKRTAEGLKKAIEHFKQAVAQDPGYALAYAGLADCYSLGVWYIPLPPSEAVPKMKAAAAKALELDDALAEAHVAMASVHSFEWNFLASGREHERAIELNPGYATAHHWRALYLALIGHSDEAIAEIKRAREVAPLSLVINTDLGWVYYLARRYQEAIEQYQKTLELDPSFTLAHFDLALAYAQTGRHAEAISEMHQAADRGSEYLAGLGYVYALAGKRAEAWQALAELKRLAEKQYVPPYHFAWIYTGLKRKDQAMAMLQRVYEERTQHVVDFKMHPLFDSLRPDSRFQELVRRVGLPD